MDNQKIELPDEMLQEEHEFEVPEEVKDKTEEKQEKVRLGRDFYRGFAVGILVAGIVTLMSFLFRFGTVGNGEGDGAGVLTSASTMKKMDDVQKLIEDQFLFDIDGKELETYLFRGIAAGLGDIYSSYYSERDMVEINRTSEGSYRGIGIQISGNEEGRIVIQSVYDGSPARSAGLMEGDIILTINDMDVEGMTVQEAADLITEDQEEVRIRVERENTEYDFSVPLDQIELTTVQYRMLDDQMGYLKIPEFDVVTTGQFEEALGALQDEGMTGLIIDVRDNPGGLLTTLCDVLDDLLPECLLISTQDQKGRGEKLYAEDGVLTDVPVAVLVNGNTASAAEFFAGTLQDYDRAVIVGQTTFGKGIMQKTFVLDDGSALKLTTDRCLTGKGQDIHEHGVEPDIMVEEDDDMLSTASAALTGQQE